MITFEERWAMNKKRRAQLKGDMTVRIEHRCAWCHKEAGILEHYCVVNSEGATRQMGIQCYDKIVVSYK